MGRDGELVSKIWQETNSISSVMSKGAGTTEDNLVYGRALR